MPARNKPTAKKHKFVKDGVFYAELNTLLGKELAEDGYGGCEVRVTPTRTEVIILATKTMNVVGQNARRIKELTALVQKRFKFEKGQIILFAEMVRNKGLSALSQAEAVRYRLFEGLSVRRAAYSVLKFIMDRGAKGVEVTVSGKLRGQRAKSMKFRDGYMIHAGDAVNYYIDYAVKHVHLRQGVIGIKVKIMLPHDPTGKSGGPTKDLPDVITIHPPKELEPSYDADTRGGTQPYDIRTQGRYAPNIPAAQDIDKTQMQQYAAGPLGGASGRVDTSIHGTVDQTQHRPPYNQHNEQQGGGPSHQGGIPSQQFDQHNSNVNAQLPQQYDEQYDDYNRYGGVQQAQPQNFNQYDYQNAPQDQNFAQHNQGQGRGGHQQQHHQQQGGGQGFYNQNQQFYGQNNQNRGGFNQY